MEALYFPRLSLPASAWVNPALLYFDRIGVIAPDVSGRGLYDDRTNALISEGLVRRIFPHEHPWSAEADERFVEYVRARSGRAKLDGGVERIHIGKFSHSNVARSLERAGFLWRADDEWLEAGSSVARYLMTYLAIQLSCHPGLNLPLVTDEGEAWRSVTGPRNAQTIEARRLRAVNRLLPVPSTATVGQILEFRQKNARALHDFRNFVESLLVRDPHHDATFEERLTATERLRRELEAELRSMNWGGAIVGISLSAAAVGAASLEGAALSAGVGALALGTMAWSFAQTSHRQARARKSPLAYAALASHSFSPRAAQDLLA